MTIEEEVFKKSIIDLKSLIKYGFKKTKDIYKFEKKFMEDEFCAIIEIDNSKKIKGRVIDLNNNEEYLPLRMEYVNSAYKGIVKNNYIEILEDIKKNCAKEEYFISNQSNRIAKLIFEKYNIKPDFPFKKDPAGVFRNLDNQKWFGLIMNINSNKLDKNKKGEIEVINIKLNQDEIENLINIKGFYKAYHMNKKHWITIILDDTLSDEIIFKYIIKSYDLVK